MKPASLLSIIIFFFSFTQAQDSTLVLSRFEKFSNRTGTMFKNESMRIGKSSGTLVFKERTTDLTTGETKSAIKIRDVKYGRYGILYIDEEELDGLTKALEYYLKEIKKGTPKYAPEYYFITTNDVMVNCSFEEDLRSGWFISLNRLYHYSRGVVDGSYIKLKNKDIDDFIETINQAKNSKFE